MRKKYNKIKSSKSNLGKTACNRRPKKKPSVYPDVVEAIDELKQILAGEREAQSWDEFIREVKSERRTEPMVYKRKRKKESLKQFHSENPKRKRRFSKLRIEVQNIE